MISPVSFPPMSSAARLSTAQGAGLKRWSNGDDLNWELEKLQQGAMSHYLGLALRKCMCVCVCGLRIPVRQMTLGDLYVFKMSVIFPSHLNMVAKVGSLC